MQLHESSEAELALVSALLVLPAELDIARDVISPADFAQEHYGLIFASMCRLEETGRPIDKATILADLVTTGGKVSVADLDLVNLAPYTASALFYAATVREASLRRRGAALMAKSQTQLVSGLGQAIEIIDGHTNELALLEQGRATGFQEIWEVMRESVKQLEERRSGTRPVGLLSGIKDLDSLTHGFREGDVIVLAARPSMGKTSFAMNVAANVAIRGGKGVGILSLEMPSVQLVDRMSCSEARVDSTSFRSGVLLDSDWAKLAHANTQIAGAPILLDDAPGITLAQVRSKARSMAARLKSRNTPLALLIIDYLQLMAHGESKSVNRDQAIGNTTRGLKTLAKQLAIPIVVLSQLNRDVDKRTDKRPSMSDLRESGNIEQDADTIAFLYRDEIYNPWDAPTLNAKKDGEEIERRRQDKGTAEVIIAKQRGGAIGTVRVQFDGPTMTFRNIYRGGTEYPRGSDE